MNQTIFLAGILIQFSNLEDFLYFLLNGQSLSRMWSWMSNIVINLEVLFGHISIDFNLLVFCIIIVLVAIFILFDGYGYIWKKIKLKN